MKQRTVSYNSVKLTYKLNNILDILDIQFTSSSAVLDQHNLIIVYSYYLHT